MHETRIDREMLGGMVAAALLCALPRAASAGYDCGKDGTEDTDSGKCICPRGKQNIFKLNTRTGQQDATCVPAPQLPPPELLQPADGATDVNADTMFTVTVPSWADSVVIEICRDEPCRKSWLLVRSAPDIKFSLGAVVVAGQTWRWRARGRKNGEEKGPWSVTRSFTLAMPTSTPEKPTHTVHDTATPPTTSSSAAAHLALARTFAATNRCAAAITLAELPHDADPVAVPALEQLAANCRVSLATSQIIAAVDAGDLARADQIEKDVADKHPELMPRVAWAQAYYAAKRTPPACESARQLATTAQLGSDADPGSVAQVVATACPDQTGSLYAMSWHQWPISGRVTASGTGVALGVRFDFPDNSASSLSSASSIGSFGFGAAAVQPYSEGIDGRIGPAWGGELRGDVGTSEPATLSLRFEGSAFFGGGHFKEMDDRHRVFVFDVSPGLALKLQLASWLRLVARGGVHMGFATDFGKQADAGLTGLADRFHGMMALDAGVMLDVLVK